MNNLLEAEFIQRCGRGWALFLLLVHTSVGYAIRVLGTRTYLPWFVVGLEDDDVVDGSEVAEAGHIAWIVAFATLVSPSERVAVLVLHPTPAPE